MKKYCVDLRETHQFSSFFLDYIEGKAELRPFYTHLPKIESFKQAIEKKEFPEKKIVLVFVEIRPDAEEKETLVVDGKRMPTCWSPPVAKLDSEDSYQALLDYCTKGIKENKWKKEVKNGKK